MRKRPSDELFERHAELCQVLCNAKRLKILYALETSERTVTDIVRVTQIPQPTVSQHLRKMRDKDVVTKRTEGNRSYYSIRDDRLLDATTTIRTVLLDSIEENPDPGVKSRQ